MSKASDFIKANEDKSKRMNNPYSDAKRVMKGNANQDLIRDIIDTAFDLPDKQGMHVLHGILLYLVDFVSKKDLNRAIEVAIKRNPAMVKAIGAGTDWGKYEV